MSYFKRIMYLDYCCGDERQQNIGFVKWMQWRIVGKGEDVEEDCFQICMSESICNEEQRCVVKIIGGSYCSEKSGDRSVPLGEVILKQGRGILQANNVREKISCEEIDRAGEIWLRIELGMDTYACCMLRGIEREEVLEEAAKVEMEISAAEQVPEIQERPPEDCRMEQMHADKWMQLWKTGVHIRPFGDEREYLQVDLKMMVVLAQQYYHLVENSFLLHGYYNYGHLTMVKMIRQGRERICLGVPGNYYKREVEVAVMFGFESFESEKEPPEEGEFGYYFISVGL